MEANKIYTKLPELTEDLTRCEVPILCETDDGKKYYTAPGYGALVLGVPCFIQDDSVTALNLTLSTSVVAKFKAAAQQQQISQRELMERLINTL